MGFEEISRSQPTGVEENAGYGDGLGWVSDSAGVFSCLSLGTKAIQVNGVFTLMKDGSNANETLMRIVRGSMNVEGGNVNIVSEDGAGGTLDTENIFTNGSNRLRGSIVMTPEDNKLGIVASNGSEYTIDMHYPLDGMIFISKYDETTGRYDFVQANFYDMVKEAIENGLIGVLDDIEKLKSQTFVRQDSVHSVQEISAVKSYPANPREGVFYLLQES